MSLQRARLLVVAPARPHPELLAHRDLHVVDVAPVPDRLEDPVGEAEDHDVLHGLLAEVVIDAVDLPLVHDLLQRAVERDRRVEVAAERLLDHEPPPALVLAREAGLPELARDLAEERRRRRQVEEVVAAGAVPLVGPGERGAEPLVGRRVVRVALRVDDPSGDPLPQRRVEVLRRERLQVAAQAFPERVVAELGAREADDGHAIGEQAGAREVVEGRRELAAREIARRAEDHEHARPGRPLRPPGLRPLAPGLRHQLYSWCPPNSLRMAESSFSPKVCVSRDRNRA